MRIIAETLRFALCLAIVIVGTVCAIYISSGIQSFMNVMEQQAREMQRNLE